MTERDAAVASSEHAVSELAPGRVIGSRFRLERLVGEGGIGAVWQATNTATRSSVALKFLKADDGLEVTRRRLMREARTAAAVQHANVRSVFDVIELDDGSPVLVMEYLDGEALSDRLKRSGKLSVQEAATVLAQVASGVGAAHAAGIVHRDLKPQNIFLVRGSLEAVKVVDFGIAKWRSREPEAADTMQTASGAILGTPYYMSPEQVFGERTIDHRTDVWSLGLVLYECLTGTLPTRAENVGQVMKIIVSKPLPAIDTLETDLPADLAELVTRMLSRAPDKRPASLDEVLDRLEAYTPLRAPRCGPPAGARETSVERADVGVQPETVPPEGQETLIGDAPLAASPARGPTSRTPTLLVLAAGLAGLTVWAVAASRGGTRAVTSAPPAASLASASATSERTSDHSRGAVTATATSVESVVAPSATAAAANATGSSSSAAKHAGPRASSARATASAPASATTSAFTPSQKFE
jgi:predicted Ser/Thr protein kinase